MYTEVKVDIIVMKEVINDCYINKIGVVPTDEKVVEILKSLPDDILFLAQKWGEWDTEVMEKIYDFI